jgi:hypothetical protein
MKTLLASVALLVLLTPTVARPMSDGGARKAIIRESLAGYPGPCPCPYNVARNGSSCGRRSAYSRPGGYSPTCYDRDVTDAMIRQYKATH